MLWLEHGDTILVVIEGLIHYKLDVYFVNIEKTQYQEPFTCIHYNSLVVGCTVEEMIYPTN